MKLFTVRSATIAVTLLGTISLFQNCGKYEFSPIAPTLVAQNTGGPGTPGTGGIPTDTCNPDIPGSCVVPTPTPTPPGNPGDPTPTPTAPGHPGEPTPTPTAPGNPGNPTPTPTAPGNPGDPTPTPTAPGNPGNPTPTPGHPGEPTPTPTCTPKKHGPPEATPTPPPTSDSGDGYVICYLLGGHGKSDRSNIQISFHQGGIPTDVCMPEAACLVDVNNYLNAVGGTVNACAAPTSGVNYVGANHESTCAHNPNVQKADQATIDAILNNMAATCQ